MTRSILFVGGSHTQRIAVRSLHKAGFDVHVTDRDMAPPCEVETPYVHHLDATDVNGIAALATRLQEDGTLIGAYGIADYAMPAVAAVNRLLGGRAASPAAMMTMIDKDATKLALRRGGVPTPGTLWAGDPDTFDARACAAPDPTVRELIVKPANVHASLGIARVSRGDSAALADAVRSAGVVARPVLVEEYLDGCIWNVDALAIDGVAHAVSVTRRIAHERLAFLPSVQIQPRRAEEPQFGRLAELAQRVATCLAYRNGPFTIDLIQAVSGPKVLEVSPHFHSITLEILRRNGNPLLAWMRYLAGDSGWQSDLEPSGELAGALAMLRAETLGRLVAIEGEDVLAHDSRCAAYVRLKPDGTVIRSRSAAGGLLALAWWIAPGAPALEADLCHGVGRLRPRVTPVGAEVVQ